MDEVNELVHDRQNKKRLLRLEGITGTLKPKYGAVWFMVSRGMFCYGWAFVNSSLNL